MWSCGARELAVGQLNVCAGRTSYPACRAADYRRRPACVAAAYWLSRADSARLHTLAVGSDYPTITQAGTKRKAQDSATEAVLVKKKVSATEAMSDKKKVKKKVKGADGSFPRLLR